MKYITIVDYISTWDFTQEFDRCPHTSSSLLEVGLGVFGWGWVGWRPCWGSWNTWPLMTACTDCTPSLTRLVGFVMCSLQPISNKSQWCVGGCEMTATCKMNMPNSHRLIWIDLSQAISLKDHTTTSYIVTLIEIMLVLKEVFSHFSSNWYLALSLQAPLLSSQHKSKQIMGESAWTIKISWPYAFLWGFSAEL